MKMRLLFWVGVLFLTLSAKAQVVEEGKGALNVETFPEGVTITLLGKDYKNTVEIEAINAGQYKCMLRKDGYLPIDTLLEVKAGLTNYYNLILSPEVSEEVATAVTTQTRQKMKGAGSSIGLKEKTKESISTSSDDFWSNLSYIVMLHGTIGKGLSEGGLLGAMYKDNGIYVKGLTTIGSVSDSKIRRPAQHGNPTSLDKKYRTKEILVGYLRNIADPVIGYVGVGYGHHRTFLDQKDGWYRQDIDAFEDGVAFELGAIVNFKPILVSVGYNTVNFGAHAFDIGVGVKF